MIVPMMSCKSYSCILSLVYLPTLWRPFSNRDWYYRMSKTSLFSMPIIINLDVMLAKRKMRSNELAEKIGLTTVNLSILKTGKIKAVRLSTLEAICKVLECQPGDILEYKEK